MGTGSRGKYVSRRESSHNQIAPVLEQLEGRTLLSAVVFGVPDFSGSWGLEAVHSDGAIVMDGAGNIASSPGTFEDGTAITLTGTYNVSSTGAVTAHVDVSDGTSSDMVGAANTTKDLIAMTSSVVPDPNSNDASLAILVKHSLGNFSNLDMAGTWTIAAEGTYGSVILDNAGNIVSGSITDDSGHGSITGGTYTVDSDGNVTLSPTTNAGSDSMSGTINDSKDTMVLDEANLGHEPGYVPGQDAGTVVFIKRSSGFTNADAAGTWTLSGMSAKGTVTLDGKGHLSGSITEADGNDYTMSGTYHVSANGTVTSHVAMVGVLNHANRDSANITGGMNGSKNFMAFTLNPPTSDNQDIITMVKSALNTAEVGSLTSAGPVTRGDKLLLTAHDATIEAPGAISTVQFYRDKDGNGLFDPAKDTLVGTGKHVTGTNDWTYNVNTKGMTAGSNVFFARAKDKFGRYTAAVTVTATINDRPPVIASLTTHPVAPAANNLVTLTANRVADADGKVVAVSFYWDRNNTGDPATSVLLGTDNSSKKGWSVSATLPSDFPASGPAVFLAQAVDNDGASGNVVTLQVTAATQPTIAAIQSNPNPINHTLSAVLTAQSVVGLSARIVAVEFWVGPAGTPFGAAGLVHLGHGARHGADWTLTIPKTRTPAGNYVIYAQAKDANGILSNPLSLDLSVI